jgi:hypothetical protein
MRVAVNPPSPRPAKPGAASMPRSSRKSPTSDPLDAAKRSTSTENRAATQQVWPRHACRRSEGRVGESAQQRRAGPGTRNRWPYRQDLPPMSARAARPTGWHAGAEWAEIRAAARFTTARPAVLGTGALRCRRNTQDRGVDAARTAVEGFLSCREGCRLYPCARLRGTHGRA